jgi:hypothetical protein
MATSKPPLQRSLWSLQDCISVTDRLDLVHVAAMWVILAQNDGPVSIGAGRII